jgi:hypothetical protein
VLWMLAAAALSMGHPPAKAAKPPPPPKVVLYLAARDKNMEVVVDANADHGSPGLASLVVFFFYAQPVQGRDMWADNFQFDCTKGTGSLVQTAGEGRHVEPLDLGDVNAPPDVVPRPSLMAAVMDVACRGEAAIPPGWTPLSLNLRQISRAYYESYLGQKW